MQIF
jgi:hypothetical protein